MTFQRREDQRALKHSPNICTENEEEERALLLSRERVTKETGCGDLLREDFPPTRLLKEMVGSLSLEILKNRIDLQQYPCRQILEHASICRLTWVQSRE